MPSVEELDRSLSASEDQFQETGESDCLEEIRRSATLGNLAIYLHTRFEQSGKGKDLDGAITLSRESLTLQPLGHPRRSTGLENLALDLEGTPDEVIHLSAVQLCGFRSIVGALRAMTDQDSPDAAEDSYGHLFQDLQSLDLRDVAMAQNIATMRKMRRGKAIRHLSTLPRWVDFVHIGA